MFDDSRAHLTTEQTKIMREFLHQRRNLFAKSDLDLGKTNVIKHHIETGETIPIKQPWRRVHVHMSEEVDQHVEDMLKKM